MSVQIHEFLLFDSKETWKNNKLIFGQTNMIFDGCHRNVKNNGNTIDVLKSPQRRKEELLKVQLRIISTEVLFAI